MLSSPETVSVKPKNPDFLWWSVGGCGMFLSERLIGEKKTVISEGSPAQGRLSETRQSVLGTQLLLNPLFAFSVWLWLGNLPSDLQDVP